MASSTPVWTLRLYVWTVETAVLELWSNAKDPGEATVKARSKTCEL